MNYPLKLHLKRAPISSILSLITFHSLCCPVLPRCFQQPGLRPVWDEEAVVVGEAALILHARSSLAVFLQQLSNDIHGSLGCVGSLECKPGKIVESQVNVLSSSGSTEARPHKHFALTWQDPCPGEPHPHQHSLCPTPLHSQHTLDAHWHPSLPPTARPACSTRLHKCVGPALSLCMCTVDRRAQTQGGGVGTKC